MLQKFKILPVHTKMLVVAAFLVVINFIVVIFLDITASRIVRVINSIVAFVFYVLYLKSNSKSLHSVFVLLIISNICIVYFDQNFGLLSYTLTSIIAYSILLLVAMLQVEWKKIKWYEYVSYLLIFIFNLYTVDYLMGIIEPLFDEKWMYYMIKALGVTGMSMCLFIGFYNATRVSFKSAYLMYASFGFVFSEFAAMLAYYFEIVPQLFFLLDRALHLFALYFLIRYAYMVKLEKESISS